MLVGCVSFEQLNNGLTNLEGASQDELFRVLGYPDSQQIIDSDTILYVWRTNFIGSYSMPTVHNTTGYIGMTPFSMQTTSSETKNVNYQCIIKYAVQNGRAYRFDYSGNLGGCEQYINRLKKYNKIHPPHSKDTQIKSSDNKLGTQAYPKCLREKAAIYAKTTKDFEQLWQKIESICSHETGYKTNNLAKFYAQEALKNN